MAPDFLRSNIYRKASGTLFRHTAADPFVGFDIFMKGNCYVSNQRIKPWRGTLRRQELHCLIRF